MPLDEVLQDLQGYQNTEEEMAKADYEAATKRIQEVQPMIKRVIESMDDEQKKKYKKKAEKKVMAQTLKHREKLQKKFDEVATVIPNEQKI